MEKGCGAVSKPLGIKRLNHDTTEIEIELSHPFTYEYGQFAFLKIFQKGFETKENDIKTCKQA